MPTSRKLVEPSWPSENSFSGDSIGTRSATLPSDSTLRSVRSTAWLQLAHTRTNESSYRNSIGAPQFGHVVLTASHRGRSVPVPHCPVTRTSTSGSPNALSSWRTASSTASHGNVWYRTPQANASSLVELDARRHRGRANFGCHETSASSVVFGNAGGISSTPPSGRTTVVARAVVVTRRGRTRRRRAASRRRRAGSRRRTHRSRATR